MLKLQTNLVCVRTQLFSLGKVVYPFTTSIVATQKTESVYQLFIKPTLPNLTMYVPELSLYTVYTQVQVLVHTIYTSTCTLLYSHSLCVRVPHTPDTLTV